MRSTLFCVVFLGLFSAVFAQYPVTEIYTFRYKIKKGEVALTKPQQIAANKGYNNQPYFVSGTNKVLFVSIPEGDSQSDVYAYDTRTEKIQRVTQTPESEFSPKINHENLTAVRIECGPDSIQRLWKFSVSADWKASNEYVLFSTLKGVGYYDWVNRNEAGIFIVGEKEVHSLHYLNTEKPWQDSLIADNIGRSVWKIPYENTLSFVQKTGKDAAQIETLSFRNGKKQTLIPTFSGGEDFVWHPKGYLLTINNEKLYAFNPKKKETTWTEVADLQSLGLGTFYRLAFHPNGKKIALVKYEGKKP